MERLPPPVIDPEKQMRKRRRWRGVLIAALIVMVVSLFAGLAAMTLGILDVFNNVATFDRDRGAEDFADRLGAFLIFQIIGFIMAVVSLVIALGAGIRLSLLETPKKSPVSE